MPRWITITEADVLAALNNAELNAYRTVAKQAGQDDPLPAVITSVTDDVRSACAAGTNKLNTTGIPASLRNTALDVIIYRLANRVAPQLAEKRKPAHDEAIERLGKVESGKRPVEKPDTAASATFQGAEVVVSDDVQPRRFKRDQTNGL